jgi:hypothetical protein
MKQKRLQHPRDWHERRLEAARYQDQPRQDGGSESKASRETFPHRTKKPGQVGLANEARPGLGTRADMKKPKGPKKKPTTRLKKPKPGPHDDEPLGRVAPLPPAKPRPAPRDQRPDSLAHEQERDTGVSGHTGSD